MGIKFDEKTSTWTVKTKYKDWTGKMHRHQKSGFKNKDLASEYETNFLASIETDLTDMTFGQFVGHYLSDRFPNIRTSTKYTKMSIIDTHIMPYFENKKITEINSRDIMLWQNTITQLKDTNGKGYQRTYLRKINAEMRAIFNHAVIYYDLPKNPALKATPMGKKKPQNEPDCWTLEEYTKFIECVKNDLKADVRYYYMFEILFWTGIRIGELLALTKNDFDFENKILDINKSWSTDHGGYMHEPKTEKSYRKVYLSQFLADEIEDFLCANPQLKPNERIFQVGRSTSQINLDKYAEKANIKRIKIHGLRHSHAALLLSNGFTSYEVAERLGHESITVTQQYSHLYREAKINLANKLNDMATEPNTKEKSRCNGNGENIIAFDFGQAISK